MDIYFNSILVDALSGHEDGCAFADVQKLFQHVVEAVHMEGAAFEA